LTCVVGLVDHGQGDVLLAADSAGVNSNFDLSIRTDAKVFRVGHIVIGCTSSFRMMQLLRFNLTVPIHKGGRSMLEWAVADLVPAVRKVLRDGGWSELDKSRESGGCFLVGVRGQLLEVQSDFQGGMVAEDYDAVGCGAPYALGSLFETGRHKAKGERAHAARARAQAALEAATRFSAGVRGPYVFERGGARTDGGAG
jgi:hypothetical protein